MSEEKGIRALAPGVVLPDEEKEILKAREEVMRKIDAGNNLQAAAKPKLDKEGQPSSFKVDFPIHFKYFLAFWLDILKCLAIFYS